MGPMVSPGRFAHSQIHDVI